MPVVLELAPFGRLDCAGITPDNRAYMTDRLSGIVDAVRLRVEEELRQQLSALTAEHERALEEALREAAHTSERQAQEQAAASEARWSSLLSDARENAQQMVEAAVVAARAEFDTERKAVSSATSQWMAAITAQLAGATTLTEVLDRLGAAAARSARGALFVPRGGTLERWPREGAGHVADAWTSIAAAASRTLEPRSEGTIRAVPILLDRTAVAVLVAPEDGTPQGQLEQLALIGTARLAAVTASRLVQADRWINGQGIIATPNTMPAPATIR